ncbi:MAG TPA: copper chaperone PCu(A)C [Caulobacteraceae bacterium]|nr:copper chaperone PCu(A)C [Caulobacteraceae bacterium]
MRSSLLVAAVVLALAGCAAKSAPSGATVDVKNAWIRTPPPGAPTAAGYATITNHAIASDRLTGAYSSAAASVGLHEMSKQGGVMRMQPIAGGLAIGSSATVKLDPNGRHLMLTGLKHPLKAGERVRIVLQFQRAGPIPAEFVVRDDAGGGMRM